MLINEICYIFVKILPMDTQIQLIESLHSFRSKDLFHNDRLENEIIATFFPKNINELVGDLSNVTSAFYGLLLKIIGDSYGNKSINDISERLFYELGKLKTTQAMEKMNNFPIDTRAYPIVLISAIYNASPEYRFEIKNFTKEESIIELSGVDRYHRITSDLSIHKYLNWPTLKSFVDGITDSLKINCLDQINLKSMKDDNTTICEYKFTLL